MRGSSVEYCREVVYEWEKPIWSNNKPVFVLTNGSRLNKYDALLLAMLNYIVSRRVCCISEGNLIALAEQLCIANDRREVKKMIRDMLRYGMIFEYNVGCYTPAL